VTQQVWTQVWQRLGSLNDPRRLRAWLYSVARNAAIDASQEDRRRRAVGLDVVGDRFGDAQARGPVWSAVGDELRETLLRAVEALPALYREPFVLRHLEDWSYAEIGELLGLSVETVETRLVRARRLLREMLQGRVQP
jgi:RNA polymerase sigma-70 factor (ECF subfamily)